ncbi:hypothetical protein T4B_13989 [Trichinella pseudospiralis]|uniref:Uncharacterized protein n=1 Tax=Trichinella pseudospiralis TaxID=6337 RepID=A0A0V1IZQ6_TRIPS|nr:hypothetical protein T4B_13989 [Trichinella pseudospiralis]
MNKQTKNKITLAFHLRRSFFLVNILKAHTHTQRAKIQGIPAELTFNKLHRVDVKNRGKVRDNLQKIHPYIRRVFQRHQGKLPTPPVFSLKTSLEQVGCAFGSQ